MQCRYYLNILKYKIKYSNYPIHLNVCLFFIKNNTYITNSYTSYSIKYNYNNSLEK